MILFIDTHNELITIAIKTKNDLFVKTKISEYSHSIFTMPMIEEIFDEHKLDIKDLEKIIVVNGPGSFTGIRIGLSIAKTMAYALNIKINTISSLKAYMISDTLKDDKMVVINDNKGSYIYAVSKDNKVLLEEQYVNENKYNYREVPHKLDINEIIKYCDNLESENPHHIKANYIKKIEVENND